jgi:hypothetical protein
MMKSTVERFGRLDVVFNNAFTTRMAPVGEISLEERHKTISVALFGVFYGMRFALPRTVAQGGGVIVNTATISGLAGDYGAGAYNAVLVNLTRSAAIEEVIDADDKTSSSQGLQSARKQTSRCCREGLTRPARSMRRRAGDRVRQALRRPRPVALDSP